VLHAREGSADETGVFVDETDWSYVALGGEHRRRKITPTVQYPGSLERVALDPWDEAADEKGFLTVDLERGESVFHSIPGRAVAALAPIRVTPGDPDRLRRRVEEVTREVPGGIGGKIVRLCLEGVDPKDLLALQGDLLHGLRQTALHLAVEAGRELRAPAETWFPADSARLLREAIEAELERDGLGGNATADLIQVLVPDPSLSVDAETPFGALEAVDGDVPEVGRVSTSIPPGLTAVIGGAGRSRRAVADLLVSAAETHEGPLKNLWTGRAGETLDGAVHLAVEAVAEARGLGVVTQALERARDMGAPEPPANTEAAGEAHSSSEEARQAGAVRVDPELVAAEFRSAQRELQAIRADAAEVDGDLEVATMDWLRERQDAETTLHAYRDRARELKARIRKMESAGSDAPCPTCGRILESHYDEVLTELGEEWEAVVQDGSWWKRRWEQLEMKPDHLQELEGRALRLHAALEGTSERVELLRARLGELEGKPVREDGPAVEGPLGEIFTVLLRVRDARLARARDVLLSRASRYLGRISGGRILAVTWNDGSAYLEGDSGPLMPLSEEDLAAGRLAVRLAAASLVSGAGQALASLVIEEPFDRLDVESGLRTLVLLRSLLEEIPRIVLVSRGEAVDARPELFESVLEVRDDAGSGSAALRPAPAGAPRLILKEHARRARKRARRR
jgi:hypothetical protein